MVKGLIDVGFGQWMGQVKLWKFIHTLAFSPIFLNVFLHKYSIMSGGDM